MRTHVYQVTDVLKAFQGHKVLTKAELLKVTGCSTMTAWRLLKQHGYWTSYNENAGYYTLRDIPQFDEHGLWSYRHVRFSKWGSLTKTLVGLVQESSAGLTSEQLEQLLQVENVKPVLSRLIERQALTRQKITGRYVYFPRQPSLRGKQRQRRDEDVVEACAERTLPPLDRIIALLVEIIRHPRDTYRQWMRRLRRQGIPLDTADIEAVLTHYGIDLKKGLSKS